jgi:hypothetical protein
VGGGVQLGPLGTAATNRPIVPTPGDYCDGKIGGMMTGRGNRSTRRKPAPASLSPPQTPHAARTRTRAAAVGSQRLAAWATALPDLIISSWTYGVCVALFVFHVGFLLWPVDSLLGNDSVNIFSRQRIRRQQPDNSRCYAILFKYSNRGSGVFYVVRIYPLLGNWYVFYGSASRLYMQSSRKS